MQYVDILEFVLTRTYIEIGKLYYFNALFINAYCVIVPFSFKVKKGVESRKKSSAQNKKAFSEIDPLRHCYVTPCKTSAHAIPARVLLGNMLAMHWRYDDFVTCNL